jgi:hypothetical protein
MVPYGGSYGSMMSGAVLTEAGYTFSANQYAQVQIQNGGANCLSIVTLIVHYKDANNYNYINFQGGPMLFTVTNGVGAWVGDYSGGVTAGHVYRVQVIGNNYQLFDNGVSRGTLTTSVNSAAGATGIGIDGYDTTTPGQLINFQTNNCTSTCPADTGPTATPTFGLAAGTYTSIQSLTISDATSGATIYYTTDGSTPTTNSAVYSSPINVSTSETVNAIATASGGYYQSSVGTASYVINLPVAATPTFGPGTGTYSSAQPVTISDSTPGATIYYTTNGTTPTTSSALYTAPLNVSSSETLEAIAVANGYTQSGTGSAMYAIQAATPVISPAAGSYTTAQPVTISDSTPGVTIYYTTNGTTPTISSAVYTGPINVGATETIEAMAVGGGYSQSATASAAYTLAAPASWPFIDSFGRVACVSNCGKGGGLGPNYTLFSTPSTVSTYPVTIISNAVSMTAWSGVTGSIMSGAVLTETGYTFSANQYAQVQMQYGGLGSGSMVMLIVHYQDANNFNFINFQGNPMLFSVTNGVGTWVGNYSGNVTDGHVYRVQVIGNNYQVFDNGISRGTLTTSANSAAGPTGIGIDGYTSTPGQLINFQTNNCTSTCPADTGTPAATPTFSPVAGTYTSIQSVTISDATSNATIYYTTDGSTPTTGSEVYSTPISVSTSETVSAIAAASGYYQSSVGTASYVINLPLAATPTFSPSTGTYITAQSVTISDSTPGATIYYTTDGTTPTTSSAVYSAPSGPLDVSSSETLQAIAVATGYKQSATGSAIYSIMYPAATPTFNPAAGTYTTAQSVTLSDSTPGTTIYYTTNGTTPTLSSAVYTGPINVGSTETIEAIAAGGGYSQSPTGSAAYTILVTAVPTFSPGAGSYTTAQPVTISDSTSGATIYYTTDGTTPGNGSPIYNTPINVSTSETLKAIAVANGYSASATASAAYTIQVATPTFSPAAGSYTATQSVTIADATSGATIYYTTDGSTPTTNSAVYSTPISVSTSETVKAIATASGYAQSAVGSAAYSIGSLANGTYMIENLASGLVLDGGGAGTMKGTWVIQDNNAASSNQQWTVTSLGTNTYQILGVADGLSLDDYQDATANGTGIDAWTTNGSSGQIWHLTPTSDGYYTIASQDIVNAGVDSCIEPSGGSAATGAQIVIYSGCDTPTSAQQWAFVPVSGGGGGAPAVANGTYQIQNLSSGMVLDGGGSGTAKGTWVVQDASTSGSNQAWTVTSSGNAYTILGVANGLSLDDYQDATANGTEIDSWTINGSSGQIWYLTATSSGYYTIASQDIVQAGAGACIEPSDGSAATGAQIVINNGCKTPTSAQQWTFVPVSNLNAAPAEPTFNPGAGTYNVQAVVTISTTTPGATIYYTTDGTKPTTNSTVYSGPITVTTPETLNAMATVTGYTQQSAVASASYTITYIAANPTFTPVEGTYNSPQTVTISESAPGATIYYTTDGSTPTTSSAEYNGPVYVSTSETIQAMSAAPGYASSAVATATYTIANGSAGYCSGLSLGDSPDGTANLNGIVPFPATNAWNVNIANAPVDPNNAAIQASGGYAGYNTHINFGSSPGDGGIPFIITDSTTTPVVPINVIGEANQSDVVVAPYPNNVPIEGNPTDCSGWPNTGSSDQHSLVLDRHTCWLYEAWITNRCNGRYDSTSETIWDMANGEMRPWGWTSADAAGLSVLAGLVRYDEAASGHINHAIRFTMQNTKNDPNNGYFVEPATHAAGTYFGSPSVMGMRVRLKSSFDISGYSAINQAILTAMQQYGMIVADNGGYFFIQGAWDSRWDDSDLSKLNDIPSSEFDVIQMSPQYPGWDSATAPTGQAPTINSFTASATQVSSGSPVTFTFNLSNDSYDYIDVIGPVRTSGGTGSVTINPTATEPYTLYSTNQYGQTKSTQIIVTVPGSTIATPTFNEPGGTYGGSIQAVISTSTYPFAQIYYTTDGSQPSTSSTRYTGPVTVSTSETINAIAVVPGYSETSAVGSATYTIN